MTFKQLAGSSYHVLLSLVCWRLGILNTMSMRAEAFDVVGFLNFRRAFFFAWTKHNSPQVFAPDAYTYMTYTYYLHINI